MVNKTPLLLAGTSDRANIACARSLSQSEVDFSISLPKNGKTIPWGSTPYRGNIIDIKYGSKNKDEFIEDIIKISKNYGGQIIYPADDLAASRLSTMKNELRQHRIEVPLPHNDIYKKLADKRALSSYSEKFNIKKPSVINNIIEKDIDRQPIVAKPKSDVVNGDTLEPYIIGSTNDLNLFFENEDPDDYFFQEYIDGCNVYYCGHYNSGVEITSLVQYNILQQPNGGSVIKALPNCNRQVIKKSKQLLSKSNWNGPIMIEYIINNGKPYIIEANARLWGPLQLCVDNNVDIPLEMYKSVTKQNVESKSGRLNANDKIGYYRYEALLQGYWQKFLHNKPFNSNPNRLNVKYKDPWFRSDTYIPALLGVINSGLYPMSKLLESPRRTGEELYNIIKNRL